MPENGVPAGNTSDHMPADMVVRIEPWGADDLPLLEKLMGDPEVMVYLGGPESQEQILERQARYEALMDPRESQTFKIVYAPTGEGVGSVGYWEHDWRGEQVYDEQVYETGWLVLPAFQGRGIATAATARAIEKVKLAGKHRFLHAFPSVENPASNTLCRKLGFTLMGAYQFEYPRGHFMQCNDWLLDLRADGQESSSQE